jgi:hypothetical protein
MQNFVQNCFDDYNDNQIIKQIDVVVNKENETIIKLDNSQSLEYLKNAKLREKIDKLNGKIIMQITNCSKNIMMIGNLHNVHTLEIHHNFVFGENLIGDINIANIRNTQSLHTLKLNLYKHIKYVYNLSSLSELDITFCKNIKDIGSLRNLKILKVHEKVNGIQYLKNLDEIVIMYDNKCSQINSNHNIKKQLAKLIKINPVIKIKEEYIRPMSGMGGGIAYSN